MKETPCLGFGIWACGAQLQSPDGAQAWEESDLPRFTGFVKHLKRLLIGSLGVQIMGPC